MVKTPKILMTYNYRLFEKSPENRLVKPEKHLRLKALMQKHGFIPSDHIVCVQKDGKLYVKAGQHRLYWAEVLGLPVYYTIEEIDYDVAEKERSHVSWTIRDYAEKHAALGLVDYKEGLAFADQHAIPVGIAFAMLAGTVALSNIQPDFADGKFRIKDRPWANAVASLYSHLVSLRKEIKGIRFLEACMAVCRVEWFNSARLVKNARRCRGRLVPYSTRDGYLDALEKVYNYGRQKLEALKIDAIQALRDRDPSRGKKK